MVDMSKWAGAWTANNGAGGFDVWLGGGPSTGRRRRMPTIRTSSR